MSNLVTLRPGARGTIQLVHKYGEQLIYVRYRYNADTNRRYKTIELIVDEQPWLPRLKNHARRALVSKEGASPSESNFV